LLGHRIAHTVRMLTPTTLELEVGSLPLGSEPTGSGLLVHLASAIEVNFVSAAFFSARVC